MLLCEGNDPSLHVPRAEQSKPRTILQTVSEYKSFDAEFYPLAVGLLNFVCCVSLLAWTTSLLRGMRDALAAYSYAETC
jgi:hypothetical protein